MPVALITDTEDHGSRIDAYATSSNITDDGSVRDGDGSVIRIDLTEYARAFPLGGPVELNLAYYQLCGGTWVEPLRELILGKWFSNHENPIISSNLLSTAYHTHYGLFVRFQNGSVYRYPSVTPAIAEALRSAESAGKFFAQHIKPLTFAKIS